MAHHQKRRPFVFRRDEITIAWRVKERMSDQAVFGRELDGLRSRYVARVNRQFARTAKSLEPATVEVEADDAGRLRRRSPNENGLSRRRANAFHPCERRFYLFEFACRRVEDGQC